MKVELIKPQGYCAGVMNAIKIAGQAKKEHPNKDIFVIGMLVHNEQVVKELDEQGIKTINLDKDDNLPSTLKKGDIVIFSAHGHDEKLDEQAKNKSLIIYDCTCPIVRLNLQKIKDEVKRNHQIIYIGQKGHRETEAALSLSKNIALYDINSGLDFSLIKDASPLVINQTTLNFISLKEIHQEIKQVLPQSRIEDEICNATRQRQEAILKIENDTDLIIVVGDKKSSNCNKLFDIAKTKFLNASVYLIGNIDELKQIDLTNKKKAAVSSGASTPIFIVNEIYNYLLNYQR